ncbi:MAG: phosphatidate cytidylyltransferase [Chitinophagaceae bacterium]
MAFHWQTFRTRAITAIIFAAVMLAGLLWDHWSFLVLFSIIHFGCWWEYFRLLENIRHTIFHPYTKLGFMVLGYSLVLWFCGPAYRIAGYGLSENFVLPVSAAGFALLLLGVFQKTPVSLRSFGAAASGVLYLSLSCGMMIDLREVGMVFKGQTLMMDWGRTLPCGLIVSIWINDTMAYIVGSLIGKTPFSKISPKKTWEGTIGGAILCVVVIAFAGRATAQYTTMVWIGIAAIAAVIGTMGDLLESKLKRMAGVKDSGRIMPGHGGFLDRFDSLLLAIPFAWLYVVLTVT